MTNKIKGDQNQIVIMKKADKTDAIIIPRGYNIKVIITPVIKNLNK